MSSPNCNSITLIPGLVFLLLAAVWGPTMAAPELDDPMRPPTAIPQVPVTAKKDVQFYLSSTLIAEGRRIAVINGKKVSVGDRINGARVEEIMPARVKLRLAGKIRDIHLLPLTVKRPSNGTRP